MNDNKARKKKKNEAIENKIRKVLIVFGSFIVYFVADGVSLSSGILIRESIKHFQASATQSSLTASLLQSVPLFLSPFVCILIGF